MFDEIVTWKQEQPVACDGPVDDVFVSFLPVLRVVGHSDLGCNVS